LNSTPNPAPTFIIGPAAGSLPFFAFPQFGAFDSSNNLWISDSTNNAIFEFTAAQLASAAGVATSPSAILTSASFNGPLGIVFDSADNLWVANNGGTTIIAIAAATLTGVSGITPVAPVTTLNTSLVSGFQTIQNPWALLFDANENLWLDNEQTTVGSCSGTVVEFKFASITGGGTITPAPNVVITPAAVNSTESLCDPNGLTMNTLGNITVANAGNSSLAEYTATQITTSGALVPNLFLDGANTGLNAPAGLIYGPLSLQ
jgi:large repetitive protein